MSIARWNPWRELEDVFTQYAKAGAGPRAGDHEAIRGGDWAPRVDIAETDKEFVIKAEIPEVQKEDVKVTVDKGVLAIRGERKQEKEEKDKKFHRIERHYGSFIRSFTLPENVEERGTKATFKDGMLTIQLPKTTLAKERSVEVKIE